MRFDHIVEHFNITNPASQRTIDLFVRELDGLSPESLPVVLRLECKELPLIDSAFGGIPLMPSSPRDSDVTSNLD